MDSSNNDIFKTQSYQIKLADILDAHKDIMIPILQKSRVAYSRMPLSRSTSYYFCKAGVDLFITSMESLQNTIVAAFHVGYLYRNDPEDDLRLFLNDEWEMKRYNGGSISEMIKF